MAAMAEAFGKALGGILASQAQQIEGQTKFLGVVSDLSAKQTMRLMGQKGGRTTQERKRKAKQAVSASPQCRLCHDPMARNVEVWEVVEHQKHETLMRPLAHEAQDEEKGN